MLGKVAIERLAEQEKVNKQLSQKSKELERSFALAQSTNVELEKKVAELAEALKTSHDEKKIAEATLEQSKKELEKVRKSHEDDLRVIEIYGRSMSGLRKPPKIFVLTMPVSPSP
jgi:septal ring factor EnvC (AmiA/AmiB activator)